MELSNDPAVQRQWQLLRSYMQSYAAEWKSGYGFLTTDLHLVVLRLSLKITSDGLATSRLRRPPSQPPHKRIASDSTDASSQLSAMSVDTSMYSDNVRNLRCHRPDYVAALWRLVLDFYFSHSRGGKGLYPLYLSSSRQLDAAQRRNLSTQHLTGYRV